MELKDFRKDIRLTKKEYTAMSQSSVVSCDVSCHILGQNDKILDWSKLKTLIDCTVFNEVFNSISVI